MVNTKSIKHKDFQKIVEELNWDTYICTAVPWKAETDHAWQIKKITSGGSVQYPLKDGEVSNKFVFQASERTNYTYTFSN